MPMPQAVPPMTTEAKQLSREIKAATWGDRYAEVWEIKGALRKWEHGLTAAELRTLARDRSGANWFACQVALGEMRCRNRDIVQALHNIADRMEQRAHSGEVVIETEVDPWAAAWAARQYDQLLNRCQRLAGAMLPWAQAWTDDKGRSWQDLIDRNPQHANSPFRQDVVAECKRRGLVVAEEGMAEAIRRLFGLLVESDARPLPGWVEDNAAEPLTATDLQVMQPAPAADDTTAWREEKIGKLVRLVGIYRLAIGTFDEYGDLIGAHLETLAAKRELEKLIKHMERETALLEGRPVPDAWMVEEVAA
jgi:hypothetical protein